MGDLLGHEPVSKQALSSARHKIGVSAFQELHERALRLHYEDNPLRKWKGYRVLGGDGSTLQLPKRGDLPDFFGAQFSRTCLARVMQYTELTSDVVVSAGLMPYSTSENTMAKEMLPPLVAKMRSYGENRQIYVYDRGFPLHAFAQRHLSQGVDFLFRVQRRYGRAIIDVVERGEEASFSLEVRRSRIQYNCRVIIRFLDSGQPLILVTSLTDTQQFTDDEIVDLYRLRWRSEESYKFQKTVLQLDGGVYRTYHGVGRNSGLRCS